jgi:hypothetical protein
LRGIRGNSFLDGGSFPITSSLLIEIEEETGNERVICVPFPISSSLLIGIEEESGNELVFCNPFPISSSL